MIIDRINDDITLYNADCMEVLKTMSKGCIDLIVTDAPYDSDEQLNLFDL